MDNQPLEIWERIEQYVDDQLETKLKSLRSNMRQLRKAQEAGDTGIVNVRDNLRREYQAIFESLQREYQTTVDALLSKITTLTTEVKDIKAYAAIAIIKAIFASAICTLGNRPDLSELLARKYEAAIVELQHTNDPITVAGRFNEICIGEGKKAGLPIIGSGLSESAT